MICLGVAQLSKGVWTVFRHRKTMQSADFEILWNLQIEPEVSISTGESL